MNTATSLIYACFAMLVLVGLVSFRLIYLRNAETRSKRLHPQKMATSTSVAEQLVLSTSTADNYRNLFELPVLFYILCAFAVTLKVESAFLVYAAWLFVALRYAHSLIHCTYNKVMHRFPVFLLGFIVLVVLWGHFIRLI